MLNFCVHMFHTVASKLTLVHVCMCSTFCTCTRTVHIITMFYYYTMYVHMHILYMVKQPYILLIIGYCLSLLVSLLPLR